MRKYLLSAIYYLLSTICAAPASGATLDNLCNRIGFGVDEVTDSGCTLTNGTDTLRFFAGGRRFELNRRSFWLNAPAMADSKGGFTFEYVDMVNLIAPLFATQISTNRPLRVQLDAGHGGEDAGCISPHGGLYEKDLVLDIALRAGEILSARGIEVIYTRTNDTFVSLAGRSGIAAKHKADAFVAIHANYAENQTARGIETFTLPFAKMQSTSAESSVNTIARVGNANDMANTILGHEIQRRMPGRLGEADRGLRHARYQVLRDTPCPAVLVEIGFLSNKTESRNLSSNWYRDKIALAIADGVCAFSDRRRLPLPTLPKAAAKGTGNGERGTGTNRQTVKPSNCQTNEGTGNREQGTVTNRPTVKPSNCQTNEVTGNGERGTATNKPLNRLTAQPLNSHTNNATMQRANDATTTNAVPSATNAVPPVTKAVPSATNAVPPVTKAIPSATNAVPPVTNAVPSVTNAPPLSASLSKVESRKPKAIECRRELSNAVDYLLSPIPYLLSPIFHPQCSPLS